MTFESRETHPNGRAVNILVVAPYYPPAVLAGGPIRSVAGLVDQLHHDFNFFVLALDHDLGHTSTLTEVDSGSWTKEAHAFVRFEPDHKFTFTNYRRWIAESNASVIYLNTFFSPRFSLLPLAAALLAKGTHPTVVLAPRGQLMREALSLKARKKVAYVAIHRLLGLPRKIMWHATSNEEAADLRTLFGSRINVKVARQIGMSDKSTKFHPLVKSAGQLRVIFLSRISPMKNLAFAIQRLASINGEVFFTIAGPMEDKQYTAECVALAKSLPASVTVEFIGPVEHAQVAKVIAAHHLFFLPSRGENYGHAIVEALYSSRPVLISNRTPWHNLARRGLGHDISLSDLLAFEQVLQRACDQSQEEFDQQIKAMPSAVAELLSETLALEQNRLMFQDAVILAASK